MNYRAIVTIYTQNIHKELILKNNWIENFIDFSEFELKKELLNMFGVDILDIEVPTSKNILSPIFKGEKNKNIFHIRILTI